MNQGNRGTRYLLLLSLGALGVVYGDIGTSPLYAMRESFLSHGGIPIDHDNVLGVLSLIFWSLTIVISVKYLAFVMRADNHGEGGILALTALIRPARAAISRTRWLLIMVGIFGTALLYGDGMITPAISVLSAVEGLGVATDALDPYIIPLAIGILVALFAIQHRGTGRVGAVFGPVMIVWFGVLGALGVIQIVRAPQVLAAVDPRYGVEFFARNGVHGFLALGSVFLVVTGSEALYADMGHFGKRPIQLGWFGLVFPALLLNYLGQGALLLGDPSTIDSPFYRLAPGWALYPMVVLATAATIIASQALISGAFSLTLQAVQLGYLPRVHIRHTSALEHGQVYIPSVNWALMLACIGLVLGFRSSSSLAAAYGVAVAMTMVITTILLFLIARERWQWRLGTALALLVGLLVVDLSYLGANLFKIPDGGWFPIVAGLAALTVMTTWKRGRELLGERLRAGHLGLERFIASLRTSEHVRRVPGTAVYMYSQPGATPPALLANVRHNHAVHETVLFVSVLTEEVPRVPPAARAEVWDLGDGFHQVVLHYGFMQEPAVPEALGQIVRPGFGVDLYETTFVLGRETVLATQRPGMALWRERLFALMARNATDAATFFHLPSTRTLEIGVRVEI